MPAPEIQHVTTADLPYLLSLPASQSVSTPLRPLLCFLHGYDEAAPTGIREGVTRHGPLRRGSAPVAREAFIVVAPQLPRAGDLWHRYADAVMNIVEDVRMEHGGDAKRLYLSGFSFGGNGVFDLALGQPDTWAALWPVDPTRVPPRDVERPVWLSIGEIARRNAGGFIRSLGLARAGENPRGDRVYLDEGEDHVGSARLAYRDARIYAWLLDKKLP